MGTNGKQSEVELLRARVVILEQLLKTGEQGQRADRTDDAVQRLRLHSELLNALVTATDPSHREDFFHALVYHLAVTLKVRYVVVGEFHPEGPAGSLQTVAVWANGEFAANFTFELQGMPCAHLVQERSLYCEAGVQQRFPQAQMMKDLGVEGYCEIPLYRNSGSPVGLLAVLDTKPLKLSTEVQSLLMLFASRAGAELERKRADEALRTNEERYARATAVGKVGVWELECSTGAYHGDRNLKALYGYGEEELGTDPFIWLNLVHPDDRATAMGLWQAVVAGERDDYLCELRMVRKDGTIIYTEARGQALRDDQGRLLHLIGSTVDITERRRTEDALRLSGEKLRQALHASNTGLWDWNTETNEVSLSKEWKRQLGYEEAEIADTFESWGTRLHPGDHDRAMAYVQAYLANPIGDYQQEFRLRHKDGTYRWIEAHASFVPEPDGSRVRLLGSHTDITERKHMEDTLRQRERDLRMALEERERISQDLHDGILQSLFAVGLGLEACKPLVAQQRKKAAAKLMLVFNRSIRQLNQVMGEVRNFIAGLESQVLQGGDFATLLRTMVQSMVSAHPVRCKFVIDRVVTSRLSTEQALHLMNVMREALSNSLRHSQAKKTTVSLKQLAHSVRLSVTDDGIGFNPATAHGAGHGLANMAARAQKIGGRFAVQSKPGQGTKILFDLPKEKVHQQN